MDSRSAAHICRQRIWAERSIVREDNIFRAPSYMTNTFSKQLTCPNLARLLHHRFSVVASAKTTPEVPPSETSQSSEDSPPTRNRKRFGSCDSFQKFIFAEPPISS
jgi:hypothetical protein